VFVCGLYVCVYSVRDVCGARVYVCGVCSARVHVCEFMVYVACLSVCVNVCVVCSVCGVCMCASTCV
jgi:hypothetical protein